MRARAAKKQMTIFIHTSGTSNLDDNAKGAFKSDKIYRDTDRASIDSVPDDAPHRDVDVPIIRMGDELKGKAKLAVMVPPLIYGCASSRPLFSICRD